ncbi:MAG: hypothetical protein HW405_612, partial [Candidatus Berkelbacteria bacterium]|nr:hypothetical protein [Candidatus Berkelbacteria bacterium]
MPQKTFQYLKNKITYFKPSEQKDV